MSTPSRSTRSKTRALRHFPNDKPRFELSSANAVQAGDANSSDDDSLWEDVSDVPEEGDNDTKLARRENTSMTTPRRQLSTNPRRRKRAGNNCTPTRKQITASMAVNSCAQTPTKQRSITPQEETLQTAPIFEVLWKEETKKHATPPAQWSSVPMFSIGSLVGSAVEGVLFGARYAFDVIRMAIALLRMPLGLLLFLWLLATILLSISQTLRAAFSPVCWIPFISSSIMCHPLPPPPQGANYPVLVEAQTKTFEQLLDEASGGSALSLEVKKAEMATSDLITLVRISTLRSKDLLAGMLSDFVQDAKKTGKRLHKLHSKVGGSVDIIMAVNDHALRTIEQASHKKTVFSLDTLIPWTASRKNRIMTSTFNDAMDTLSTQISRLILEAEANIENLNDLEERLGALHELASREVVAVKGDREELLAQLWTILGGNRKELKNFNENLVILKNVGTYRNQARMHVTATLQTLQSLSEDMEDLRERVATPGLVGESIPLEVQVKSIQYGLERLRENRMRARRIHDAALDEMTGSGSLIGIGS